MEYIIEKVIIFTDFDNTQTESRKTIDYLYETYVQEKESEIKEKIEGEKKIYEHFTY